MMSPLENNNDSDHNCESLQKMALESNRFVFAFGCAPCGFNEVGVDWRKLQGPKKTASFDHIVNYAHLLESNDTFVSKQYWLIVFTKTRWSTCVFAVQSTVEVRLGSHAKRHRTTRNLKNVTIGHDLHDILF
uniref:Uncharacterized protein n=1 Tax=Spongospora subterranea TaxID=70186 RepID=A0A0H5QXI7_9EUKA|eukprot:CRZ06336.1 hypothetical protein [Spongospora subterranea]